jgi:hypothetical protein
MGWVDPPVDASTHLDEQLRERECLERDEEECLERDGSADVAVRLGLGSLKSPGLGNPEVTLEMTRQSGSEKVLLASARAWEP